MKNEMRMATLFLDGMEIQTLIKKENQLEEMVKKHAKDIFCEDSIYFEKRKK